MHFALAIWMIAAVWRWGDWRNWQQYHTTMLYFALGNVTYNFLCANYLLWKLNPDLFPNHSITELVYTFIVFPATALLFLTHYPEKNIKRKIIYYLLWIFIYIVVEWMYVLSDRIHYQFGWNTGWSLVFDIIMFPMLRLFYKRPLLAYPLSVVIAVFWIWLFDIPIHIPIEERHLLPEVPDTIQFSSDS